MTWAVADGDPRVDENLGTTKQAVGEGEGSAAAKLPVFAWAGVMARLHYGCSKKPSVSTLKRP